MWTQASEKYPIIYDKYHERVCHAILAHHGTREWGSPIAPLSRVAWLVHLCDNLSARMYDAETLDIVKHYK
jgi:23S rRNA maturation-related 3'-5' exoribonuclease YhaM